jgi:uncharacterized protein YecE (DUF72 family)
MKNTRRKPQPEAPSDRTAWRAAREARRENERARSVERARLMHIARLAHEQANPGRPALSSPAVCFAARTVHVGCSGWYYRHWSGSFYPERLAGAGWFPHYASTFDTVELNAPFYAWPALATVAAWKRQVSGRAFVYAVKVNELITHIKRFNRTSTLVKDFGFIADLLGPHFGCFLFQLPASFKYSAAALRRILKQLDPARRNVVEFRDASWWRDTVFRAFAEARAVFCSVSAPRLPDEIVRTTDDVYIRFHGRQNWYRHDYSNEEIATWARRIRESGAKQVWAYFNNDREGYAIGNARELRRQLEGRTGSEYA